MNKGMNTLSVGLTRTRRDGCFRTRHSSHGWRLAFTKVCPSPPICYRQVLISVGAPFGIGSAIMIMSLILFENEFLNIVSISFTALVLNELIMVALEITTWYDVP